MKLVTFKDIFSTDVEPPSIILIEGAAGTLKSAMCFSLMLEILKNPEFYGLYLTFEQTWQSHLVNMRSLGFVPSENLLSLDYNIMRKEFKGAETQIRIFDSIMEMITSLEKEKKGGFKIFALDSLNAIYSIMDNNYIEQAITPFFKKLKQHNIISLLIYENVQRKSLSRLRERFLADGIISMGIQHGRADVVRFLQPLKYNGCEHSLKRRHLVAAKDGISLLGPVYQ